MAKKLTIKRPEVVSEEEIIEQPIEEVMSQGFGRYSKYVLQERAVPDVRDGLKPVQRRIIYYMYHEGNVSTKPTRKCAKTVGGVIGTLHPHGDASVYEAMVRLSQDWKMRYPLVTFQGNNGSIDGDGPAAYRYTEAKLSELSDLLVADLNKNVVDMDLNFDDSEFEPTVLPARFPNLLANGSSGIAVGASTDIPPHNLGEVIDAITWRIGHKHASTSDLLEFIKGPDFPTGGVIKSASSLKDIYEKGSGSFKLYAKVSTNTSEKSLNQIIIEEIPYGKDKSEFVNNIDRVRFANKLDAILEVRDETGMEGLRIVIDVKKDADLDNLVNFLYSKNCFSTTVKFNMLVIDHYKPKVCSLLEVVDCYIEHQIDVITRRSQFDLDKSNKRLHIVNGLVKAVSILDQVVKLIRSSKDKQDAKNRLVSELSFSEEQAEAILMLQLYRLTNLDISVLMNEKATLENTINDLEELLASPTKMNNLIKSDLNDIKKKYGDERRTAIEDSETDFKVDKLALISKDEVMVSVTRDGYIKRTQMRSYNSSNGSLPGIKTGDAFRAITKAYTTDFLITFTSFGNYLVFPVYQLNDNKWKDEGGHINEIGQLNANEKIVQTILVSEFKEGIRIGLITKKGQIKRVPLKDFETQKYSKPIKCIKVGGDDELVDAIVLHGNTNILGVNADGYSSFYNESEVNEFGLKAGGIKAISTKSNNVVGMLPLEDDERCNIVLISEGKAIRNVDSSHLVKTGRLGAKQQIFKTFKSDPQTALYVGKMDRKAENYKISVILENLSVVELNVSEVKPQPFESYLKSTNEFVDSPFKFVDSYKTHVDRVDENTKVEVSKVALAKPAPSIEEEKDDDFEQLSLFDFVDDD